MKAGKKKSKKIADRTNSQVVVGRLDRFARFKSFRPRKNAMVVMLSAIFILALLVGVITWRHQVSQERANRAKQAEQQRTDLLSRGIAALDDKSGPQLDKLEQVVNEIQAQKDYDKDPSYLYMVLNYYIQKSNAEESKKYLDKLGKVYHNENDYSPVLRGKTLRIDSLRQTVEYLQNYDKLNKGWSFPGPIEQQ